MKEIIILKGTYDLETIDVNIDLTIDGVDYDLFGIYTFGVGFEDHVEIENESDGCIPYDCELYDRIVEAARSFVSSGGLNEYNGEEV